MRPIPPLVLASLWACATVQPALHPETVQSAGTLTDLQRAYDVQHYRLELELFPEKRTLSGTQAVTVQALEELGTLELDLDPRLTVDGASRDGQELSVVRDGGKVRISLAAPVAAGEEATIRLRYSGAPYVAEAPPWDGGFVWSKTPDGHPWIATAVQGRGCDLWWPCKDHYGDKPNRGIDVIVTVPAPLKVAMTGLLVEERSEGDRNTFHWRTQYPQTAYSLALNAGPYERVVTEHESRDGSALRIEFWALPENAEKARRLIETDVKPALAFFESHLGPYPWRREKVGFVETPHLGMEHQTINAYGEGYKRGEHGFDGLLHHELAHEWFGNLMTHAAAEDAWLHEGYALYMQPLYAEERIGPMGYAHAMLSNYRRMVNCTPVVQRGVADAGKIFSNRDIYYKAGWMLHTIREIYGDQVFWDTTRRLLYGTPTPWADEVGTESLYRSTDDFTAFLSETAGEDLSWLVGAYLEEAELPVLEVERDERALRLRWRVPEGRRFALPVPVQVSGERRLVPMPGGEGHLALEAGQDPRVDPALDTLRRLPIIGDCQEQTEALETWTRNRRRLMAIEYGWDNAGKN